MATDVEAEFAGERRRFDLLADVELSESEAAVKRLEVFMGAGHAVFEPPLIERAGGNLSAIVHRAKRNELSYSDVRQVLSCGLACGARAKLQDCDRIVAAELKRQGYGHHVPLAMDVLQAAFAGRATA